MLYTVQKGDNLTRIARRYGVLVEEIVVANDIADPNRIYVGQELLIPVKEPAEAESKGGGIIDKFLDYLHKQINHIYVWGAQGETVSAMEDPAEWIADMETSRKNASRALALYDLRVMEGMDPIRAFDCSGLIMRFLNDEGLFVVDLSSRGLFAKCDEIAREDLKPGDLLFRHNGEKIHHVGVYVGGRWVIEAMGRDVGVVKRDIDASGARYWNRFGRLRKLQEVGD